MEHIIHITTDFDRLKSILESNMLRLSYCKEVFYLGDKKISDAAHPMICFSEYNISTIDKETITYGKFGIAFKQSWIEKHRIHRVLYINKNSLVAKSLGDLLKARRKNAKVQLSPKVRLSIMMIKCFTKNERGYNSRFSDYNFNFKSENEWRYVPAKAEIDGKFVSENTKTYEKRKDYYNQQMEKYSLKFDTKDIAYIFVETNEQAEEVRNLFSIDSKKIKISNWNTK